MPGSMGHGICRARPSCSITWRRIRRRTEWPPSLTRLVSAGAPLDPGVAERFRAAFGVKIHSFYGTSETGGIAFDDGDGPATEGFVGRALPGVEISLRDSDSQRCWPGSRAELSRQQRVCRRRCGGVCRWRIPDYRPGDSRRRPRPDPSRPGLARLSTSPDGKCSRRRSSGPCANFLAVVDARVIGLEDRQRGEKLVACLVISGDRPSSGRAPQAIAAAD